MKKISIIIITILIFTLSCKKENVITNNNNNNNNSSTVNTSNTTLDKNMLKKYLREGFIANDTFRVIIISPRGSNEDIGDIKRKAQNRARLYMRRYIKMKKRSITYNTRAQILILIRNKSTLYEKKINYSKGRVFYFDVKKRRIRAYLYGISSR